MTLRRSVVIRRALALFGALLVQACLVPDFQFNEVEEGGATAPAGGSPGELTGGGSGESPGGGGSPAAGGALGQSSGGAPSGGGGSGGGETGTGGAEVATGGGPSDDCYGTPPLLFADEFEDGADCWETNTSGDWSLATTDGYSSSQGFQQTTSVGSRVLALAGEPGWEDVYLEAYIKVLGWGSGVLQDQVALIARYQDESNFYYASMSALGSEEKMRLKKSVSGISSQIGTSHIVSGGWELNTWYHIAIEVRGTSLRAFINGVPRLDEHTDDSFSAGRIGVGTMHDATIVVDGVRATQL